MALVLRREGLVVSVICWDMTNEERQQFLQEPLNSWTVLWRFPLELLSSGLGIRLFVQREARRRERLDLSNEQFSRALWFKLALRLIPFCISGVVFIILGSIYFLGGLSSLTSTLKAVAMMGSLFFLFLLSFAALLLYPTARLHYVWRRFRQEGTSRAPTFRSLLKELDEAPLVLTLRILLCALVNVILFALAIVGKDQGMVNLVMIVGPVVGIFVLFVALLLVLISVVYHPFVRLLRTLMALEIKKFLPMVVFK